jgi:hypothetical protein
MSKILISGCGISWSLQERPTWVNVLKICGVAIDDQAGPAISNQLILDNMISAVINNNYSQAVCQLTSMGKLDVEINNKERKEELVEKDTIRNFTFNNYWPSSVSSDHLSKKLYYQYLYSPTLEENNLIYKWMLLDKICKEKNIKLHTILGYKIEWTNTLYTKIKTDFNFKIYESYKHGDLYKYHDHSLGIKNTVPNKNFAVWLAKYINNNFLKLEIEGKLKKFKEDQNG